MILELVKIILIIIMIIIVSAIYEQWKQSNSLKTRLQDLNIAATMETVVEMVSKYYMEKPIILKKVSTSILAVMTQILIKIMETSREIKIADKFEVDEIRVTEMLIPNLGLQDRREVTPVMQNLVTINSNTLLRPMDIEILRRLRMDYLELLTPLIDNPNKIFYSNIIIKRKSARLLVKQGVHCVITKPEWCVEIQQKDPEKNVETAAKIYITTITKENRLIEISNLVAMLIGDKGEQISIMKMTRPIAAIVQAASIAVVTSNGKVSKKMMQDIFENYFAENAFFYVFNATYGLEISADIYNMNQIEVTDTNEKDDEENKENESVFDELSQASTNTSI